MSPSQSSSVLYVMLTWKSKKVTRSHQLFRLILSHILSVHVVVAHSGEEKPIFNRKTTPAEPGGEPIFVDRLGG